MGLSWTWKGELGYISKMLGISGIELKLERLCLLEYWLISIRLGKNKSILWNLFEPWKKGVIFSPPETPNTKYDLRRVGVSTNSYSIRKQ